MNRKLISAMALLGVVALAACSGGAMGGNNPMLPQNTTNASQQIAQSDAQPQPATFAAPEFGPGSGFIPLAGPNAVREVCPQPANPRLMRCFALERTDLRVEDATGRYTPQGYGPKDLQSAYNLSASGGKGVTVAIIDAGGYSTANKDLAVYRKTFGLPACSTSNGCLKIVNEHGTSKLPPSQGWEGEEALDMDMVSAICPNCKILLVQASQATGLALYTGVQTAAKMGAAAISNSYGGGEAEASDSFFDTPGHMYVASAGDSGGGVKFHGGPQQPCSLPEVVCVGGTHLTHASNSRGWTETSWNDLSKNQCSGPCGATGSGCSKLVPKPSWQTDTSGTHCSMRSEADISADASVFTPVAVYVQGGWGAYGGTSASSPMIAAMYALAGNWSTASPAKIWQDGGAHTWDVTSGSNIYGPVSGKCASSVTYICVARPGYDGPTGWGTPHGLGAL